VSQDHSTASAQRHIRAIEDRIRKQEKRFETMIVRGALTQSAEDELRKLYATLQEMRGLDRSHPDSRTLHRDLLGRPPRRLHDG